MTDSYSQIHDTTFTTTQCSTQPIDCSQANDTQSQLTGSDEQYWGRLCPVSRRLKHHDLIESTITCGTRSSNTIVLHKDQVESEDYKYIDEIHFRIERGSILIKGSEVFKRPKIDIEDLSQRGLFVNGSKLCRRAELKHNDLIAFPANSSGVCSRFFDAYRFIDCYAQVSSHYPKSLVQNYHVSCKLGAGAFGEVHLVSNKTSGQNSAMKTILQSVLPHSSNSSKQRSKLLNEIEILRTLDHPNVVKLNDVIHHKNECFVFLEFMEGNDLSVRISKLGRLSEQHSKFLFYQICLGVKYLHTQRIIHRDIKPGNILLASRKNETLAKLTDFGLSKVLRSTENMHTLCGTKMYAAPELLSSKNKGKYTGQVDIWSLGVLLFYSLSGVEPFETEAHLIETHILKAIYIMTPDVWRNITVVAKNLVDSMLLLDPLERIRLIDILEDDWFMDTNLHEKLKTVYAFYDQPLPENSLPCRANPTKRSKPN